MKKSGLGRGLDVLLPQDEALLQTVVRDLSVDLIDPNADQPRRTFDAEALQQLADSIRSAGVLSPILVVENGQRYRIVAGERRFRAARLAGLTQVPCIVRDLTTEQQMEAALIENLQRQDLNPIEEAAAIQSLMDECRYTQQTAAQKLGKSRPALANSLRLLKLPQEIRDMVASGKLSAGHARVLCGVESEARQQQLAAKAVAEDWSVRRLEEEAKDKLPVKNGNGRTKQTAEMKAFAGNLREAFGMKAGITGNEEKGKITLTYSTAQELEAFYEVVEEILQQHRA